MTKEEAVLAMKEGKKITQKGFAYDEYIYMKGEALVYEDGFGYDTFEDFLKSRSQPELWDDGYELYFKVKCTDKRKI